MELASWVFELDVRESLYPGSTEDEPLFFEPRHSHKRIVGLIVEAQHGGLPSQSSQDPSRSPNNPLAGLHQMFLDLMLHPNYGLTDLVFFRKYLRDRPIMHQVGCTTLGCAYRCSLYRALAVKGCMEKPLGVGCIRLVIITHEQ